MDQHCRQCSVEDALHAALRVHFNLTTCIMSLVEDNVQAYPRHKSEPCYLERPWKTMDVPCYSFVELHVHAIL